MSVDALRLWQERLRAQWPASALRAFLHAWGHELLDSLPSRLQRLLRPSGAPRLFSWPLPDDIAPGSRGVLMLPSDAVLLHRLTLPLAAARDLAQVMTFELDRFTPFTAEQVYYAVRREGIVGEYVRVSLAVVRREFLDQCLERCEASGVGLEAVDVTDEQGRPMGMNLLPGNYAAGINHNSRGAVLTLGLICAALALAIPLLWIHNRETALVAMQAEVQTLRGQAAEVTAQRSAWDQSRNALQFLLERRVSQPSRAQLLSELTRCLPVDTWLQSLEMNADGQVDMSGLSKHASALIGQIKGCSHLADAQFQGVIQPDPASGRERFYLRARVRGEVDHGSPADRS